MAVLSKESLYLFKGIETTFKILCLLVYETAKLLSVCVHYYFISRPCSDHECNLTAVGSVQSQVYTQYYKLIHFFTYDTVLKPPLIMIKCFFLIKGFNVGVVFLAFISPWTIKVMVVFIACF